MAEGLWSEPLVFVTRLPAEPPPLPLRARWAATLGLAGTTIRGAVRCGLGVAGNTGERGNSTIERGCSADAQSFPARASVAPTASSESMRSQRMNRVSRPLRTDQLARGDGSVSAASGKAGLRVRGGIPAEVAAPERDRPYRRDAAGTAGTVCCSGRNHHGRNGDTDQDESKEPRRSSPVQHREPGLVVGHRRHNVDGFAIVTTRDSPFAWARADLRASRRCGASGCPPQAGQGSGRGSP
jgi:hypothetical protein